MVLGFMPQHLGLRKKRHREGRRRLYVMPKAEPLGVTQSKSEPAVMPLNLCAPPKRLLERTMTSQFDDDNGTIGSPAIRMGAFRDPTAPGGPTEASS